MTDALNRYECAFTEMPLVAILRGVTPNEVEGIADVLVKAGFRFIEVPLNSPEAFKSIAKLASILPDEIIVGAGTVLSTTDVDRLHDAGGRLMVSPNVNSSVIGAACAHGMVTMPGAMTPTECFQALDAGAWAIKIFPCSSLGSSYIKDIRAVLPIECRVLPVGGVNASNMAEFVNVGASGFGFGSTLYSAGKSIADIAVSARELVDEYYKISGRN